MIRGKISLLILFLSVLPLVFGCSSSKHAKIVKKGRMQKLESGVVLDTQTGLEWMVGPDRNTSWNEARYWVANLTLDGGRWRMPTREELKTLYQKGVGPRNMSPLLNTTGWWVWSNKTQSTSSAWYVDFRHGSELWYIYSFNQLGRAFAVRNRK